jgi:hypothetical protein
MHVFPWPIINAMHRLGSLACLLVLPLWAACETGQHSRWERGLPGSSASFKVDSVTPRAGFLDLAISGGTISRRIFSRATEDCVAVFVEGETVRIGRTDGFGPAERDDRTCPLAGIGDLEDWRGSRSVGRRGFGSSPISRSSVRIEIVHQDADFLYARGGFSIASRLRWSPGTNQVVALLPRIAECAPLEAGGFVSVLFRQTGSPALGIAAGNALCPISALLGVIPDDFPGNAPAPDA